MKIFITMAFVILLSGAAWAKVARATGDTQDCPMRTDSQITVNFNSTESDLSKIQSKMDVRLIEAQALAKQAGIDSAELQSSSYSLYDNGTGGGCAAGANPQFQVNGSMTFKVQPPEKASDFLALLAGKGYGVSINVNSYRQCEGNGD